MRITLKKVFAFIVAFIVAGILVNLGRFIGPSLAGYIVVAFDIPGGPNNARLLESVGNIFLLFIVLYISIKVYKRITRVKEDKATE